MIFAVRYASSACSFDLQRIHRSHSAARRPSNTIVDFPSTERSLIPLERTETIIPSLSYPDDGQQQIIGKWCFDSPYEYDNREKSKSGSGEDGASPLLLPQNPDPEQQKKKAGKPQSHMLDQQNEQNNADGSESRIPDSICKTRVLPLFPICRGEQRDYRCGYDKDAQT